MAYELAAPPGLALSLLPGARNVRVMWSPYSASAKAGHQVLGFRLWRSDSPLSLGTQIADENVLGPSANFFDDMNEPFQGEPVFYTLVAIEPNDFGARPFGEGGNVPFGA